ncbi:response regulator [Sunxiuqinia indica]|uniref:response regulator n=1 Tax=Sunxiuqinia indica TaxID=2692584 RepID=UPI0013568B25|nr:response regulator [Sunxiuqinia indica]
MEEKRKKVIVLAEDSKSIREAVAFGLEEHGFEVYGAEDGKLASALFDGRKVDLLLTDYHMPNMNGLELIKHVRSDERYQYVPILVLTTENRKDLILETKRAGATGWVVKPFKVDKLLQTIHRIMR